MRKMLSYYYALMTWLGEKIESIRPPEENEADKTKKDTDGNDV